MKPKLIVVGSAGRMGRRIISAALDSARFDIVAALEKTGCPDIGKDAGELACGKSISLKIADSWPAAADVAIDFSQPAAADDTISRCLDKKIALVLGTTGLTPQQHEKIKAASAKIPVLYSTNTSLGMNVLFALVGKVAVRCSAKITTSKLSSSITASKKIHPAVLLLLSRKISAKRQALIFRIPLFSEGTAKTRIPQKRPARNPLRAARAILPASIP